MEFTQCCASRAAVWGFYKSVNFKWKMLTWKWDAICWFYKCLQGFLIVILLDKNKWLWYDYKVNLGHLALRIVMLGPEFLHERRWRSSCKCVWRLCGEIFLFLHARASAIRAYAYERRHGQNCIAIILMPHTFGKMLKVTKQSMPLRMLSQAAVD